MAALPMWSSASGRALAIRRPARAEPIGSWSANTSRHGWPTAASWDSVSALRGRAPRRRRRALRFDRKVRSNAGIRSVASMAVAISGGSGCWPDRPRELLDLPRRGWPSRMSSEPRTRVESIRIGTGADVPGASAGHPICAIAPTRRGRSIASHSAQSEPMELEMNAGRSSPNASRTPSMKPTAWLRRSDGSRRRIGQPVGGQIDGPD